MSAHVTVAGMVLAASIHVAVADAPAKMTITRYVYENPADRDSALDYTIKLEMSREALDGDSIAWAVTAIQIEQHDACCADLVWRDNRGDAGGEPPYWWTTHEDIENPDVTEFAAMPQYTGVAATVNSNEEALVYDLRSTECDAQDPLCGTSTVSLDYSFRYENQSVPIDENEEEPADSDADPLVIQP